MSRNIFTNKAVGGLATAIIGLGLSIGAGHHLLSAEAPAPETHNTAAVQQAVQQAHTTTPTTTTPPAAPAAPAAPAKDNPQPAAGLDQTQMNNAQKIVKTAESMGLGEKAQVIAVATAMQESNLHNLASTKIPESYDYTNEGEGSDYDSVGLFQQRPNWGKTKELMTPETSTRKFLEALKDVPEWEQLPVTVAAQKVQVSAYPDAYAKHEHRATQIVNALNTK